MKLILYTGINSIDETNFSLKWKLDCNTDLIESLFDFPEVLNVLGFGNKPPGLSL